MRSLHMLVECMEDAGGWVGVGHNYENGHYVMLSLQHGGQMCC